MNNAMLTLLVKEVLYKIYTSTCIIFPSVNVTTALPLQLTVFLVQVCGAAQVQALVLILQLLGHPPYSIAVCLSVLLRMIATR